MLFLWIPDIHMLHLGIIAGHWGFSIVGKAFTWAKTRSSLADETKYIRTDQLETVFPIGCGYYTRHNTESCWLGVRGRPKICSHGVRELIISPRLRHSEKPPEVYDRITELCGAVAKLDLFARRSRVSWCAWGNELDVAAE
jgi:N6-adenosine-specific RNA methylase IME4